MKLVLGLLVMLGERPQHGSVPLPAGVATIQTSATFAVDHLEQALYGGGHRGVDTVMREVSAMGLPMFSSYGRQSSSTPATSPFGDGEHGDELAGHLQVAARLSTPSEVHPSRAGETR